MSDTKSQILTLIAAAAGGLDGSFANQVGAALQAQGARVEAPQWLAPSRALDLAFDNLSREAAEAAARRMVEDHAIDIVVQPAAGRRKMLLVADMDSTMITGETLDELAGIAGIGAHVAAITARAMNGEIDFEGALRERVGLLKGLPVAALDQALAKMNYTAGAEALVRTMTANGARAILVSGGFKFFTGRVRAHCGFQEDVGNDLEIENGHLTGRVCGPIVDRNVKLAKLKREAAALNLSLSLTAAVGDGANDLDMIRAAGLGVAFRAKPIVAEAAGVRIDHGDLTALLFAQGYRLDEFRA